MDQIDRTIVRILGRDARISATDLAGELPLSISATTERLRRIIASGLIRRFTIELDPRQSGRPIRAFIDARLRRDIAKSDADAALVDIPAVIDAVHVTGRYDYQLTVAAADVEDLDRTLAALADLVGTEETNTRLVLRTLASFPRGDQVLETT